MFLIFMVIVWFWLGLVNLPVSLLALPCCRLLSQRFKANVAKLVDGLDNTGTQLIRYFLHYCLRTNPSIRLASYVVYAIDIMFWIVREMVTFLVTKNLCPYVVMIGKNFCSFCSSIYFLTFSIVPRQPNFLQIYYF